MNIVLHTAPIVGTLEPVTATLHWPDEKATQVWAAALATQPALRDAVIELHGELGAGKTTLVRYLLHALGVQGRIKSPSYAVMEPHQVGGLNISHFDFYRFSDPREWEDAGFRDVFSAPGLKLIEWADNARAALAVPDLAIHITANADNSRQVTCVANTTTGSSLIA